jgi:hypothetical protein
MAEKIKTLERGEKIATMTCLRKARFELIAEATAARNLQAAQAAAGQGNGAHGGRAAQSNGAQGGTAQGHGVQGGTAPGAASGPHGTA